jgi:glucose-6-phosphate isomerase
MRFDGQFLSRRTAALMNGAPAPTALTSRIRETGPTNSLLIKKLTPHALGTADRALRAQGVVQNAVWGINAFDQPGVELGNALPLVSCPSSKAARQAAATRPRPAASSRSTMPAAGNPPADRKLDARHTLCE